MLHINVASVVFGDAKSLDGLAEINFTHPFESISIRDLIARSVELQVDELIDKRARTQAEVLAQLDKQFLGDKELKAQAQSGKIAFERPRLKKDRPIDVALEVERATKAFEAGYFKIFVNGTDHTDLDESVSYQDAMQVKFMRITPLVGG